MPDSILNTESPEAYKDNEPHRNALSKVFISHSWERGLRPGDIIVFYRTGGFHKSVVSTIGIVEQVHNNIASFEELVWIFRKKTFFTAAQLKEFWDQNTQSRPFVVEFLYSYSLVKRPNIEKLIELGIIADANSAPRGFTMISINQLHLILNTSESNKSLIVD